ncbi:chagasin family peptidase inhibitor I42 [Nonomuraea polychroma]|uniref:Chagasin family peptidase inhibitor I42 n=1 Tax=Nonomuraea polychroma TaxID=46176 RepID=A0A438MAX5_9ACTN|nr:protease inhibitor I42 family protein [Nonomuraea polychroma]RVX42837.1 chagasin family peptidase inhibitor I42 [Nonomuraea polychroma]
MRLRTAAAWLALLAVTGCGGGSAVSDYGTVVKGAKGTTVQVELRQGQRFSLAVADNPSVGDDWSLVAAPDTKVASFISEEHESEDEGPGSGGTTYFVFNSKRPGITEIRLFDCWRCGQDRTPATEESRRQSGEAIFAVTVK